MEVLGSSLVRQGSLQPRKSCVKGPMRRTKSFRVKFSKTIHYNDDQKNPTAVQPPKFKIPPATAQPDPPVIFRKTRDDPKPEKPATDTSKDKKRDGLKNKITNRRKPARRPTSHVLLSNDMENEGMTSQGLPPLRKLSVTLSPMETRLRDLALKYRDSDADKPPTSPHSRNGPLESPPVGKVSGMLLKFENQRIE